MHRRSIASVALVTLLVVALAPVGATSAQPVAAKCDAKRQRVVRRTGTGTHIRRIPYVTVAANAAVRVYRSTTDFVEDDYYVCSQRSGRAHFIGRAVGGGANTTDIALDEVVVRQSSGETTTYVAFHLRAGGDSNYDRFVVVDGHGHRLHDTGRLSLPGADEDSEPTPLALTASGALAYEHGGMLSAIDATGARVLATPMDGRIDAVTAAGQTVYWTQAGFPHAAILMR